MDKYSSKPLEGYWRIEMTCCGRCDGEFFAATWDAADEFREAYTSGSGVNSFGYSASHESPGHRRSALITGRIARALEARKEDDRG